MSDSKAKHAENAIRQIRTVTARLLNRNYPKDRWWNLLPTVVASLNSQVIRVDGKSLKYAPKDVNSETLASFKKKLFKSVPAYYWAQYPISPDLVKWKYAIGTKVRAKLVAVSSATIGNKTSEINLTDALFVIEERVAYVTRNMQVGRAYRCRDTRTNRMEVFQEDEIAISREDEEWSGL